VLRKVSTTFDMTRNLDTLLIRCLVVSLNLEESNSTTVVLLLVLFSWSRSSERALVVDLTWLDDSSLSSLVGIDSVDVLSVRVSNVGGEGVEPHNSQTNYSSPQESHGLDTNVSIQASIVESTPGQDDGSGLESSEGSQEESTDGDQEDDNLVDNKEAETENVNDKGQGTETKGNDGESERETGQVVERVSVVNELLWDTVFGGEVVDWRDWVGWT